MNLIQGILNLFSVSKFTIKFNSIGCTIFAWEMLLRVIKFGSKKSKVFNRGDDKPKIVPEFI